MSKKPEIVIVLGAPGSGKGTQCKLIATHFDFIHLSAGQVLRDEMNKPESPYLEIIKDIFDQPGSIVPSEITCELLEKAMEKSGAKRFVIDGFPRNEENFNGWNEVMANRVELLSVLYLICSEEKCIERCLKRGRSDDNYEVLSKRFDTEKNVTIPVVEKFRSQGLVQIVQADGTPDETYQQVRKYFEDLNR